MAPGTPRKKNILLARAASSRATPRVLEMLSTRKSCSAATPVTSSAIRWVCSSAVAGSASSRSRATWMSTSRTGRLRELPRVADSVSSAGTTSCSNTAGSMTTEFGV